MVYVSNICCLGYRSSFAALGQQHGAYNGFILMCLQRTTMSNSYGLTIDRSSKAMLRQYSMEPPESLVYDTYHILRLAQECPSFESRCLSLTSKVATLESSCLLAPFHHDRQVHSQDNATSSSKGLGAKYSSSSILNLMRCKFSKYSPSESRTLARDW